MKNTPPSLLIAFAGRLIQPKGNQIPTAIMAETVSLLPMLKLESSYLNI
ncbi:hypothetical protein [Neisseria weaveri]|nr:hypothetical protein [Neisseria weaveri]